MRFERAWWILLPILPILWPYVLARKLWGRREFARLTRAGVEIAAVEIDESIWRLRFVDGSSRSLKLDEICGGTCYEFFDNYGGFHQDSWCTILCLELTAGLTLILVGSESGAPQDDPLAEARSRLTAAGRVRGPMALPVGAVPGLFDFVMAGVWLLVALVVALGLR